MDLSRENLDGRTKRARTLREIEVNLVTSLGGDPSPQEIMLIKRASKTKLTPTPLLRRTRIKRLLSQSNMPSYAQPILAAETANLVIIA